MDFDVIIQIRTVVRIFLHDLLPVIVLCHQLIEQIRHLLLVLFFKSTGPEIDPLMIVLRGDHPVEAFFVLIETDLKPVAVIAIIDTVQSLVQTAEFVSCTLDILFHLRKEIAPEDLLAVLFGKLQLLLIPHDLHAPQFL